MRIANRVLVLGMFGVCGIFLLGIAACSNNNSPNAPVAKTSNQPAQPIPDPLQNAEKKPAAPVTLPISKSQTPPEEKPTQEVTSPAVEKLPVVPESSATTSNNPATNNAVPNTTVPDNGLSSPAEQSPIDPENQLKIKPEVNEPRPTPPNPLRENDPPLTPVEKGTNTIRPDDLPAGEKPTLTPSVPQPEPGQKESSPADENSTKPAPESTQPSPEAKPDILAGLFEKWPEPAALLVISGEQEGYLEPCGCAGFENMKGGLTRRHTFIKELNARKWPVAGVDVGAQLHEDRHGIQAELHYQATIDSLKLMGYKAIGFGTSDLLLPAANLELASFPVKDFTPFVSANVTIKANGSPAELPAYQIMQVGSMKIGVTSVLGPTAQANFAKIRPNNKELEIIAAADGLKKIMDKLVGEKCDRLILLAYANQNETVALAKQFPQFQFIVSAYNGAAAEPPATANLIPGTKTQQIEVGYKGMHVVALGLYNDPQTPFRYQRVAMDNRFKESPEMIQLKAGLQVSYQQLGWEGLGVKPQRHPTGREFIGSDTCGGCHGKADTVFQATPHAKAFTTLENLKPSRIYDPECVSCHVTGWNPQKFFMYETGFLSKEKTPAMLHNGCENCHGPGKAHADAENLGKATPQQLKDLRKQMHLDPDPQANKQKCAECHDLDNSPNFDKNFLQYWKKIEHKGRD